MVACSRVFCTLGFFSLRVRIATHRSGLLLFVRNMATTAKNNDNDKYPDWDKSVVREYEMRTEAFTSLFVKEMLDPFFKAEQQHKSDACTPSLLDVGCGTGYASLLASKRGFQTTATDVSKDMVDHTRQRGHQENISSMECIVANGEDLSSTIGRKNFDYAVAAFSVIFFPHPAKGMREIYKCLKKEGKVVISAWGSEEETPAFQVFPDAFRALVEPGHWQAGKPDRMTGSPPILQSLLREAGFRDIEVVGPIAHKVHVESPQAFYDRFALTSPKIRWFLEQLEEEKLAQIKDKVLELAIERGGQEDGSIAIPSMAYFAYGTKKQEKTPQI